jgi:medium-chain acyl-[acyl-carrier-protein] hydrolase
MPSDENSFPFASGGVAALSPSVDRPTIRWVAVHRPRPGSRLRLFCLPFAGGGASSYRQWSHELPDSIEVAAVQLPGREDRFREPPLERMADLVGNLVDALLPFMTQPFAFFGHSLGAIVALETTRALAARGAPLPRHVIVSARAAPHLPLRRRAVSTLTRDELCAWLRKKSGTPEAILQSSEFLDFVLPALRADLHIDDSFQSSVEPVLDCPLTAFGGLHDEEALCDEVSAWAPYTSAGFTLRLLPGNHFFAFNECRPATLTAVVAALSSSAIESKMPRRPPV